MSVVLRWCFAQVKSTCVTSCCCSRHIPSVGGQARFQFRLEVFNLFDRVNFTPPAANRSTSTFGTITSTFDARQVQLGAKLLW